MFIEDLEGRRWPVAAIRSISATETYRDSGGRTLFRAFVETKDGETFRVSTLQLDRMKASAPGFIPAEAGTLLYEFDPATGDIEAPETVIGWSMNLVGDVMPVTAHGIRDENAGYFGILHPNGRFDVPEHGAFESLEKAQAFSKEGAKA